jgi:transcriptional regulator with XRE-family HTH domain
MPRAIPAIGTLREFRRRRHMTQLGFADHADISARHLSFIETGRSHPSRDMLLRLAERLQLSLRERNVLLNAAGFTAAYSERPLADPALAAVRQAIKIVLERHKPFPAFAVDHHWTLLRMPLGTPNLGGSFVTQSGLTFIGATQDQYLRAFATATGELLWQARLSAGGNATPMTHISPASGRQFVVIAAGGHESINFRPGDFIEAYALPK